eukprot:TRINITY_DN17613_c0_g1_i1.p1 TRINITY_DN17613_c0_g1~~TRINITY_DN17613_c0_g1_i1.p1  ORF type:complete len:336 (-),score=38.24 TRINITY_DN17613_c0_g1_i1:106-1113(-)
MELTAAIIFVPLAAKGCVAGAAAGQMYGESLRQGSEDHFGIVGTVAPFVGSAIDNGYIVPVTLTGHRVYAGTSYRLEEAGSASCPDAPMPPVYFSGTAFRLPEDGPALERATSPSLIISSKEVHAYVAFEVKKDDLRQRFTVEGPHLPAFLVANGFPILTASDLVGKCRSSAALQHLQLVGVDMLGLTTTVVGGRSDTSVQQKVMTSAEIKFTFDLPFELYQSDPHAFEDKVKIAVCDAVGLDACRCSALKKHVKVVDAKRGSIELYLTFATCFFITAALVAAIQSGRAFKVRLAADGFDMELGQVTYEEDADGSFRIHGTPLCSLHNKHCCAIL